MKHCYFGLQQDYWAHSIHMLLYIFVKKKVCENQTQRSLMVLNGNFIPKTEKNQKMPLIHLNTNFRVTTLEGWELGRGKNRFCSKFIANEMILSNPGMYLGSVHLFIISLIKVNPCLECAAPIIIDSALSKYH